MSWQVEVAAPTECAGPGKGASNKAQVTRKLSQASRCSRAADQRRASPGARPWRARGARRRRARASLEPCFRKPHDFFEAPKSLKSHKPPAALRAGLCRPSMAPSYLSRVYGLLQVGTASESSAHAACDCSSSHATDARAPTSARRPPTRNLRLLAPGGSHRRCLVRAAAAAEYVAEALPLAVGRPALHAVERAVRLHGHRHHPPGGGAAYARCGCDMDVQMFTAPSDQQGRPQHRPPTSPSPRAGTVLITILGSDRSIHIHDTSTDPPTDVPMTWTSGELRPEGRARGEVRHPAAAQAWRMGSPQLRGWRGRPRRRCARPASMRPAAHFLPSLTRAAPSLPLRIRRAPRHDHRARDRLDLAHLPGDSLTSQVPPRHRRPPPRSHATIPSPRHTAATSRRRRVHRSSPDPCSRASSSSSSSRRYVDYETTLGQGALLGAVDVLREQGAAADSDQGVARRRRAFRSGGRRRSSTARRSRNSEKQYLRSK